VKAAKPVKPIKAAAARAHEVRLIGGTLKRSKLPVANRPGLRPTPDRVRETLFNWLGQDLSGWRVLDAFAGSGALGFEAASRGAAEVLLLENDGKLVDSLTASGVRLKTTTLRVQRADALAWMARAAPASCELVLLDPPFDSGLLPRAVALAPRLLVPGGFVYVESGALIETPDGLLPHRSLRAGAVHAALFTKAS
jgi:16S rRNA (guanine966-N2)-methyltransferase